MKIQFQWSEVSVLCGVSTSGYRNTLGGRGAHIIFHGQRKAAIKKCPYDPKGITHTTCGGRRVARKNVALERGECVKVGAGELEL